MKTPTNSLIPLILGLFFFSFLSTNLLTPQPAQALTWPEVGKIFGVWSRYIDDIQKTMYEQPQPHPQPTPTSNQKKSTPQPNEEEDLEERLKELSNN